LKKLQLLVFLNQNPLDQPKASQRSDGVQYSSGNSTSLLINK